MSPFFLNPEEIAKEMEPVRVTVDVDTMSDGVYDLFMTAFREYITEIGLRTEDRPMLIEDWDVQFTVTPALIRMVPKK